MCCLVSQVMLVVKNLPADAGDIRNMGSISGSGKSPGVEHGKPLQYSCLKNSMDRGAWWSSMVLPMVHWVTKSGTWLMQLLQNFVIAFLPRSKCLLISWWQSPSAVILEHKKIKSAVLLLFTLLVAMTWWDWVLLLFFFNVEFQVRFFTLIFDHHQGTLYWNFTFSHYSAIISISEIVGISATLFLVCHSFSPAFLSLYSAYKLNKQGDNTSLVVLLSQFWTSLLDYVFFLLLLLELHTGFSGIMWAGIPISWRIFQFVVIHTVKDFSIVNEAKVGVFMQFPCFLYVPVNVGNWISSSFAFFKPSLYI